MAHSLGWNNLASLGCIIFPILEVASLHHSSRYHALLCPPMLMALTQHCSRQPSISKIHLSSTKDSLTPSRELAWGSHSPLPPYRPCPRWAFLSPLLLLYFNQLWWQELNLSHPHSWHLDHFLCQFILLFVTSSLPHSSYTSLCVVNFHFFGIFPLQFIILLFIILLWYKCYAPKIWLDFILEVQMVTIIPYNKNFQ